MLFLLEEEVVPERLKGVVIWGCCWILWFCIGRGDLGITSPLGSNFALWRWRFGEEAFVRGCGRHGVSG